jgi:hypothetical protein
LERGSRTIREDVQTGRAVVQCAHIHALPDRGLNEPIALDRRTLKQRYEETDDSPHNLISDQSVAEPLVRFAGKYAFP